MLRQPSTYHPPPRGDGCSSTAFGKPSTWKKKGWNHLANRGAFFFQVEGFPAVP
jgi:hypothetical protein